MTFPICVYPPGRIIKFLRKTQATELWGIQPPRIPPKPPPCDIEEHVSIRRNIAYPDTSNSQQDILKSFSKHLEENYRIKRIELRKTDRISRPGMKKYIEENITIFIHKGGDHGTHN